MINIATLTSGFLLKRNPQSKHKVGDIEIKFYGKTN